MHSATVTMLDNFKDAIFGFGTDPPKNSKNYPPLPPPCTLTYLKMGPSINYLSIIVHLYFLGELDRRSLLITIYLLLLTLSAATVPSHTSPGCGRLYNFFQRVCWECPPTAGNIRCVLKIKIVVAVRCRAFKTLASVLC